MPNSNYQTSSVYEYVKLLDQEETFGDKQYEAIKSSINRYMMHNRKAQTNATILENLLEEE